MRRTQLFVMLGAALSLSVILILAAGCGGGGGPLAQPETGPASPILVELTRLLPVAQQSATTVGTDKCATCHSSYHDTWKQTRHAQVNTGCESCHGPGSVHATAPAKTNILTGGDVTNPIVCGQCHGPTYDQFKNSRHASPVEDVVTEGQSNPKTYVATCFRCHSGAFRAKMVDDPLAAGKTRDQIDADIAAKSADELAAFVPKTHESATCGTCHDPHRSTANLTSTGNQAYLRRATSSKDATDIGPSVPVKQYTTVNQMCGTCHNGRGVNATDARLNASTARAGMHYGPEFNMLLGVGGSEPGAAPVVRTSAHSEAPDQCIHCHMPNRRHTFTVSLDVSCAPCHTAADAAARSGNVRNEVLTGLLALRTRMGVWAQGKFGDSELWNYTSYITEESKTPPNQAQVPIEIKRARHNYYFVTNDRSFGIHNTPYTRYLLTVAHLQLDALGVSRAASRSTMSQQEMLQILESDRRRAKSADKHARATDPRLQ